MIRLLSILTLILSMASYAHSQTAQEALRYSTLKSSLSTARVAGVAGAFGAMGEDFGGISINPASLASFSSSEFSFSPSLNITNSAASFNNNTDDETKTSFGLGNIGMVFANQPLASDWVSSNFSIGITKQAIYSQQFAYSGYTPTSIVNRFSEVVDGIPLDLIDNFEGGLAYDAAVFFDYDESTNSYFSDFDNYNGNVSKNQSIVRNGKINELSLAWAGNLKRKISFGASIGIPLLSFETTKIYGENDPNQEIEYFDQLVFTEYVSTSGAGINFKLGTTFTGFKNIRLGAAVHSPNWYSLSDDFFTNLTYIFTDNDGQSVNDARSPDGSFDYRLRTPWRYITSIGGLFKVGDIRGFVNADVEFLNYSNSSYNLTSSDNSSQADAIYQEEVNQEIVNNYKDALNIRIGTELGYKALRLRGGVALDRSAVVSNDEINTTLGLGIGLKKRSFSLDFAYQNNRTNERYTAYRLQDESLNPVVDIESSIHNFISTLAFSF